MRLITFILSFAIALTCIPAFASAASKTFSPASVSTACPTYEGLPGLPLALFKHATARHNRSGGSGAYAISALPDLCLGIVSGRLGQLDP